MKLSGKEITGPEMGAGVASMALVLGLWAVGNAASPEVNIHNIPRVSAPDTCAGKLGSLVPTGQEEGHAWIIGSIEEPGIASNVPCTSLWRDTDRMPILQLTPGMAVDACYTDDFSYSIRVQAADEVGSVQGTVEVSDTFRDTMQQQLSQCVPEA